MRVRRLFYFWKPWYVVVERANMAYDTRLTPYVVGPYTRKQALEELDDECSIRFCLMTIDAKHEGYIADDCYATPKFPKDGEWIIPEEVDGKPRMRGENKALYERRAIH